MRVHHCCGLALALSATFSNVAVAQEPAINNVSPAAVLPGQATTITLQGANLAGAKGLWTSFGAQAVLSGTPENGTKADTVTYDVTAGSDIPVGIHSVRVWTDKGVSPLRYLLVDDLPSVPQAGNNTAPESAQVLTGPVAIDGTIGNLSLQYFKVTAAEGQKLSIEVLARRIGSPLDPMLRLLDGNGRELAFSDDAPGLSGDSQISHQFKAAGDYLIELRDIRYQGGAYRLRVGDFPCASVAYPLAIQRGQTAAISLAGIDVAGVEATPLSAPAEPEIAWLAVSRKRAGGASSGFSVVAVVDRPQFVEAEPNNAADQANRIEPTHDVNGRFEQPGDVDRYIFKAAKDASYDFKGITRQQGSPSDLNVKILKADGSQIATVDDTGTEEGSVTVKFPEEADYVLVVEELTRHSGSDHAYRIAITPTAPAIQLALSVDTLNIPAGGNMAATVTATRVNYGGPIEVSVVGLPAGVTVSRTVLGPGRNDALLTFTAGPEFQPGTLQMVRILGTGTGVTDIAEFSGVLKPKFANQRYPSPTLTAAVAVSTAPAPGFTWKAEPAELTFGKQLSTKTKLTAARSMELAEAIVVAVEPAKNGLPAGVTVAVKNIDKGTGEAEIVISADDKAPLGDFTIGLLGTLKQDKVTVVQPLSLRVTLAAPLTTSAMFPEAKLAAGGETNLVVKVNRNPALAGPVEVTLANLPAGVTAAATTIPADQSEATIKLTATAEAAKGEVKNIQVKTSATVGTTKFEAVAPDLALLVE